MPEYASWIESSSLNEKGFPSVEEGYPSYLIDFSLWINEYATIVVVVKVLIGYVHCLNHVDAAKPRTVFLTSLKHHYLNIYLSIKEIYIRHLLKVFSTKC